MLETSADIEELFNRRTISHWDDLFCLMKKYANFKTRILYYKTYIYIFFSGQVRYSFFKVLKLMFVNSIGQGLPVFTFLISVPLHLLHVSLQTSTLTGLYLVHEHVSARISAVCRWCTYSVLHTNHFFSMCCLISSSFIIVTIFLFTTTEFVAVLRGSKLLTL